MRKCLATALVISPALVGLMIFAANPSVPASAQQTSTDYVPTTVARPIPRTTWDGKPNLTGVWGPASYGPGPNQDSRTASPEERNASLAQLERLYQPWARERTHALPYQDDPRLRCGPYGFPRYASIPDYFLLQIVQALKEMLVLVEYTYSGYRIIPTDGSTHPKTLVPSYFGHSVGRWEGETLVVDVTGFNGKIWLQNARTFGGTGGWITSDALHQVERWRLIDADTLEYQATVEDPKVLTGPWITPKYLFKRAPIDIAPHEALCLEPEDLEHLKAAASIPVVAQTRAAVQTTTTAASSTRTPWGEPDLSGIWAGAGLGASPGRDTFNLAQLELLYRPEVRAEMRQLSAKDDPVLRCVPYTFPRAITLTSPFQIIQGPGFVTVLIESMHTFRIIPTDGRQHPRSEVLFPTFHGDSVGRWDGDTLIVDVVSTKGETWLADARAKPTPTSAGIWLTSDALHIVERWRRLGADALEYQATIEDSKMLTGPWRTPAVVVKRSPVRHIQEANQCIDSKK